VGTLSGNGNISIDINSGLGAVDKITSASAGTGTLTITSLNDLGTKPTEQGTYTYNVLSAEGVTLAIDNSIATSDDWYAPTTITHGDKVDDVIAEDTDWAHQYYTRWQDTYKGKSLEVDGGNLVFTVVNYTTDEKESMGDTLALVNGADITRNFNASASDSKYYATTNLGTTGEGIFTVKGVKAEDSIATIYLGDFTGFDLANETTLNFKDVKVVGHNYVVNGTNANAVISVDANSEIAGNITSAGTLTNAGTISGDVTVTSGTFTNDGKVTGNLTNAGTTTSKAQDLNIITNTGILNLSGTLNKTIAGNGNTFVGDTFTINDGAGVDGTFNVSDTVLTVSEGEATTHTFGVVTGDASLKLDLDFTGETVKGDVFNATTFKDSTLTITSLNAIGDKTKSFTYTVLNGETDNSKLVLTDDVKTEYSTDFDTVISNQEEIDTLDHANWDDHIELVTQYFHTHGELNVAEDNKTLEYIFYTVKTGEDRKDIDALVLMNTTGVETREFTTITPNTYTLTKDLGVTSAGTLTIRGVAYNESLISTIDLNEKAGFNIENITSLYFNNVKLTNATGDIITLNNENSIVSVSENSIIAGDVKVLAGTFNAQGVINGNLTNAGTTTAIADNVKGSIANTGTLNISGKLVSDLTGDGTTIINNAATLELGKDVDVEGNLNLNLGTLILSSGEVSEHTIGKSINNGSMTIDIDLASLTPDVLNVSEDSAGLITLTGINFINKLSKDIDLEHDNVTFQILNTNNDNLQLALNESLSGEYLVQELDGETVIEPDVKPVTTWTDEYYEVEYARKDVYATLALDTTDTENDTIKLVYDHTEKKDGRETLLDSLKMANQYDYSPRSFIDSTNAGEYTVIDNLGATAKGEFTVKGSDEVESTINMNYHSGFEVTSEDMTNLKLDSVTVQNATSENGGVIFANSSNANTTIELTDTSMKNPSKSFLISNPGFNLFNSSIALLLLLTIV